MPFYPQMKNPRNIEADMKNFNWQKIYKADFCLRTHNAKGFKEKSLAGYIWNNLKNPKVNLKNPKTNKNLKNVSLIYVQNYILLH